MNRQTVRLWSALFLLLLSSVPGWGQTGAGSIQGTVKDASGAVLPGATVTITHTQTARQYTTASTEVGFYLFPSVQMGPYEITVDMPAMETWKGELTLQVGQTAEVNPVLKIRAAATEITVAGNVTPLVTTTNPTLANVVERARIDQLPVNGRYIQNLLYMTTPGIRVGLRAARLWPALCGRDAAGRGGSGEPPVAGDPRPAARAGHDRGVPGRDQQLVGKAEPPRHRHPDDPGRNQRDPRLDLRDRPQQRHRRGARPAGLLREASAPGAQRVRRLGGRAGHPAPDL